MHATNPNPADRSQSAAVVPNLLPITDPEALRAAGVGYPTTYAGWQWLYRKRSERGLERAFKRVGRRVLVDIPVYLETIRHAS